MNGKKLFAKLSNHTVEFALHSLLLCHGGLLISVVSIPDCHRFHVFLLLHVVLNIIVLCMFIAYMSIRAASRDENNILCGIHTKLMQKSILGNILT